MQDGSTVRDEQLVRGPGSSVGFPPGIDVDPEHEPISPSAPRPGRARRAVTGLSAAALLVAGGYGIRAATSPVAVTEATSNASGTRGSAASVQTGDVSSMVALAERSVVKISSHVVRRSFFGAQDGEAVGTGFVVASDGLILTNYHVIEGAEGITVTLNDGQEYVAEVVQVDSSSDLAVLKIEAAGLSTLELGDSSQVLAGESVMAIGYALDLEGSPTVTTGIVSSTGRTVQVADPSAPSGPVVRTYQDVLQISAAINSGNSGGPLLNLEGQVIGINTAGAQDADNIGFAIPIDQAKALIESVR